MQTLEQKKEIVSKLSEQVQNASACYFVDFTGMDVELMTSLRASFIEKKISMQVIKNTLLKRTLVECDLSEYKAQLVGPTALILGNEEDPILPAKIIVDFHKNNKDLMKVKLINFEKTDYTGEQLVSFSKMPGKKELQTQILSLTLGSGSNLVGVIKGVGQTIVSQISSLVERLEK